MSDKPNRFQFRLRTLIAASLAVGLIMLLNLKADLAYEIQDNSRTFRSTERLDWYGWPMPAYASTTYPGAPYDPENSSLWKWDTVAVWIDAITAILILYLSIRIAGRRKTATPAASMP